MFTKKTNAYVTYRDDIYNTILFVNILFNTFFICCCTRDTNSRFGEKDKAMRQASHHITFSLFLPYFSDGGDVHNPIYLIHYFAYCDKVVNCLGDIYRKVGFVTDHRLSITFYSLLTGRIEQDRQFGVFLAYSPKEELASG